MREGWEIRELKEFSDIMYGYTAKASDDKSGPKYLRITDIQNHSVDWSNVPSCPPLEDFEKYQLMYGDIVFVRTGATTGKSFLINEPPESVFASYLIRVQSQSNRVLPEYLYMYFQSPSYWDVIESGISGSAQGGFNATKLGKLKIPIPPLPEQKRIVALLDEAFEAIDQAKANIEWNIENAEELFQSKLNEIFSHRGDGWEEKELSELIDLISGQHINTKDYNTENRGIGYLTGPSDFGDLYPTVSKWTEHPKRKAQSSDILVTVKGSGVGKINMLDLDEVAISRQLMAIRAKKVDTRFLYSFMKIQYDRIQELANGAAIPGISRKDVLNLKISVPDDATQKTLVDQINDLEVYKINLVERYRKKIVGIEELKKSILQKAFSGELTANEHVAA